MKRKLRSSWIVFIPAAWLALFSSPAEATYQPGLTVTGYDINQIPPLRDGDTYPVCGEAVYPNINWTWDYEENHLGECGWDTFMVRFQGFVTIPESVTSVRFAIASDDGGVVTVNGNTFGRWRDQGCSVSYDQRRTFTAGQTVPIEAWVYENGGGTCAMLFWQLNNDQSDWSIVPEWAFTTESTPPTTTSTTTVPETTVPVTDPPTTTTVQETTTSASELETTTSSVLVTTTLQMAETSTTEESTTTTVQVTTTTEEPTTTTQSTLPPATSTTQGWVPPPPSTSPEPVVTEPPVSDTEAPQPQESSEEVPNSSWVEPTQPEPENPNVPVVEEVEPDLPPDAPESPVIDEIPEEVSDDPETLLEALDASEEPTAEEAKALATNPNVLAVASAEQATQIFQALEVSELSEAEVAELIAAVQEAPLEVREAFEDTIDIFKSGLDDYVPVGSTVPVAVRRTLIAAGAALTIASSSIRRK